MSAYSMLSVALQSGIGIMGKEVFFAELQRKGWRPVTEVNALWFATWHEDSHPTLIVEMARKHLTEAAHSAGIEHYEATVAVSGKAVVLKK